MNIPVPIIVLIVSVMPFVGVWVWSAFIRERGGDYDCGIDILLYALLAILAGAAIWILYLVTYLAMTR